MYLYSLPAAVQIEAAGTGGWHLADMVCPMRFVLAGVSALVALVVLLTTSWTESPAGQPAEKDAEVRAPRVRPTCGGAPADSESTWQLPFCRERRGTGPGGGSIFSRASTCGRPGRRRQSCEPGGSSRRAAEGRGSGKGDV